MIHSRMSPPQTELTEREPGDLPALRCPSCGAGHCLYETTSGGGLTCRSCGAMLPSCEGSPDFTRGLDAPGLAQRLMNTQLFARLYDTAAWRPLHTRWVSGQDFDLEREHILELSAPAPGQVIVDLACGTGVYTRAFASRAPGALVYGIDISPGMLSWARRLPTPPAEDGEVRAPIYLRGDAFDLPLVDASVDRVNICGALHLFSDPQGVIREIARILRPGGRLTAMTIGWAPGPVAAIQCRMVRGRRAVFFSAPALEAQLGAAGLVDATVTQSRIALLVRAWRDGDRDERPAPPLEAGQREPLWGADDALVSVAAAQAGGQPAEVLPS